MLQWLKDNYQAAPNTPSHVVQHALEQRYSVRMSVSHLNATRTALGLGSRTRQYRKKLEALPRSEPHWQEGAGGLLLLAVDQETGLLPSLEAALLACSSDMPSGLAGTTPPSRRMLLLTLLFLGVVGLHRTWDLRGYNSDALGLLMGRSRAYGYYHMERFLSQVAEVNGAETFTDALAA